MSNLATRRNDNSGITVTGDGEWDSLVQQAETALASGFLPKSIREPAQAIAVAMAGRELGIPPMTAFRSIHIIEGKPSLSAELMLALAYKRVAGFGHAIIENSPKRAAVEMWRPGTPKVLFEFTIEQANAAGLTSKQVWRSYGFRMLLWRAIKFGVSSIAPDVTLGMPSVDEAEEIAETNRPHVAPLPATIVSRPMPPLVDIEPLPSMTEREVETLEAQMDEAATEQALKAIGAQFANAPMSEEQRKRLRAFYAKRRNKIAKLAREAAAPPMMTREPQVESAERDAEPDFPEPGSDG